MSKTRQLLHDLQWAGIVLVVYCVLLSGWLALQWLGWFIAEHSWFFQMSFEQMRALMGV